MSNIIQGECPKLDAKRRRLIARLKSFGQTGAMNEDIKVLRKRLRPFTVKPKSQLEILQEEYKAMQINAGWNGESFKHNKKRKRRN